MTGKPVVYIDSERQRRPAVVLAEVTPERGEVVLADIVATMVEGGAVSHAVKRAVPYCEGGNEPETFALVVG